MKKNKLHILLLVVCSIGVVSTATCPPGTYFNEGNTLCLVCPAGYKETGGSCEKCPLDTYSAEQSTSCTPCPQGQTLEEGAELEQQCVEVCVIPATQHASYRVSTTEEFYTVAADDRVATDTVLLFVCSPGYQIGNTNANTQELTCGADAQILPTYCVRLIATNGGIGASQDGEQYIVPNSDTLPTVLCKVYPVEANEEFTHVFFFKDDVKFQNSVPLSSHTDDSESYLKAEITVSEGGSWGCGLAESLTESSNRPISVATLALLTLTLDNPPSQPLYAAPTDPYTISCTASYISTMALPSLSLVQDTEVLTGTSSQIGDSDLTISKTFTDPTSEMAGQYHCVSIWKITNGDTIAESKTVDQAVDYLGFESEYPSLEDGTSSATLLLSSSDSVTLYCHTHSVTSVTKPSVTFTVGGAEQGVGDTYTVTGLSAPTEVFCTARIGAGDTEQEVVSGTLSILQASEGVTITLTPSVVYSDLDTDTTVTCTLLPGDGAADMTRFDLYGDGESPDDDNHVTRDAENGVATYTFTLTRSERWVRCGVYMGEGLYLYTSPARVYYRDIQITPDYLTLLAGDSGTYEVSVSGDASLLPSVISNAQPALVATEMQDLSTPWTKVYHVNVNNAKARWRGTLEVEVTYEADLVKKVVEIPLYITDVTISAYSTNIALDKEIVLTCTHPAFPASLYHAPLVTWSRDGDVITESDKVTMVTTPDATVLTITAAQTSDTGLYSCNVKFFDITKNVNTGEPNYEKGDDVRQSVIEAAYFSALSETAKLGKKAGEQFSITCEAHYDAPSGLDSSQVPKVKVECKDSEQEGWIEKAKGDVTSTTSVYSKQFNIDMLLSMNNNPCRCTGEFYDADLNTYDISSPLATVYAYNMKVLVVDELYSMIGGSVTMKCETNGDNSDGNNIQWKQATGGITNGSPFTITHTEAIEGVFTSSIVISPVSTSHDGMFSCIISHGQDDVVSGSVELHVLHVVQYDTAILYKNAGSTATVTCHVSAYHTPVVTWDVDGAVSTGCDEETTSNSVLACTKEIPILDVTDDEEPVLIREVKCSLSYSNEPTVIGQSEGTEKKQIITQRVFSEQPIVTVVAAGDASYACKATGNLGVMAATLVDKSGDTASLSPLTAVPDSAQYQKTFTFSLKKIAADKEYSCEVTWSPEPPLTVDLNVRVMNFRDKLPEGTDTFQTIGKSQTFACSVELLGDTTEAKIRYSGGAGAKIEDLQFFDEPGLAQYDLVLDPVTAEMSTATYTCLIEITGTDGDNDLTTWGKFVTQRVELDPLKRTPVKYYGVEGEGLVIPCTGFGKQSDVEGLEWTYPSLLLQDERPTKAKVGTYNIADYSQEFSYTIPELLDKMDGTYSCEVDYDPNPHSLSIQLTVLQVTENPEAVFFLAEGDVASVTCGGTSPEIVETEIAEPQITWNYKDSINKGKQEQCGTLFNPTLAGTLPAPTPSPGTSTIQHTIVRADLLREVYCNIKWEVADAPGNLDTDTAILIVNHIRLQEEKYVVAGQTTEVTCEFYGPEEAVISWYKEAALVEAQYVQDLDYDDVCYKRSSVLKIDQTTRSEHEGKYTCKVAATDNNQEYTSVVALKVYMVTEFKTGKTAGAEANVITQYQSASLACIASYPGGTFTFVLDRQGDIQEMFSDYEVVLPPDEEGVPGGVAAGWNIPRFDEKDVGRYECKVRWDIGAPNPGSLELEISKVCKQMQVNHGKVLTEDPDAEWLEEGVTGQVTCIEGYTLSGNSEIVCTEGEFTSSGGDGSLPECLPVPNERCTVLTPPRSGTITCETTSNGDMRCQVECNTGYIVSEVETYTCSKTADSNWDHVTIANPLGKTASCLEKSEVEISTSFTGSCSEVDCGGTCTAPCGGDSAACPNELISAATCTETGGTATLVVTTTAGSSELTGVLTGPGKRRKRAVTLDINYTCSVTGTYLKGDYCVVCPAGYAMSGASCEECAVGSYSSTPASQSCTQCPADTSTLGTQASSSTECTEVCTVPSVKDGTSYPSNGFSVLSGTTVTIYCDSEKSLEYNQPEEVPCAATLPTCYGKCAVVKPSYGVPGYLEYIELAGNQLSVGTPLSTACSGTPDGIDCDIRSSPKILHGFPVRVVCDSSHQMNNGQDEQTLYCRENEAFSFPKCPKCKSGCDPGKQWQCNRDCSCIDLSQRCDGQNDCPTDSIDVDKDEYDCSYTNSHPLAIQFDHYHYVKTPVTGAVFPYQQTADWTKFASCFWVQSSYKGRQTVLSYGGKIEVWISQSPGGVDQLTMYFKLTSEAATTFTADARGLTDGEYHRACVSWSQEGGIVDMYYDGNTDLIDDKKYKTWSVSSGTLKTGQVNLIVGASTGNTYPFHGFIKDMTILEKLLITEDLTAQSECRFPAEDSTRVKWDHIYNSNAVQNKLTMVYNTECRSPKCSGKCPVNMFKCESCDCISPWERCDLFTQHCIDNSDETKGCKKTSGVFHPFNSQKTFQQSDEECKKSLGGGLAWIDKNYENVLSANTIKINDIRTAWIGLKVDKSGKASPTWLNGADKSLFADSYYTVTTKFDDTKNVGIKNDKTWLPIYGLYSENLPYICRSEGYRVARLSEKHISYEQWTGGEVTDPSVACTNQFTLSHPDYTDLAVSVLSSRASHNFGEWGGAAWVHSEQHCEYIGETGGDPTECDPNWNILNLPSFCALEVELEENALARFTGSEDSYFIYKNPWQGALQYSSSCSSSTTCGMRHMSVCFNIKSAATNGTILQYRTLDYDNEILIYVSKNDNHEPLDILEFTVKNRVNYFSVQLLDGKWHSVCLSWANVELSEGRVTGTTSLAIDGAMFKGLRTTAEWPKKLYKAALADKGVLYLGRQGDFQNTEHSRTFEGNIMNLNIWKKELEDDRMTMMTRTEDSFKCAPVVVDDIDLILRWRDILHYGSSDVTIETTRDHQYCGVLHYEEEFKDKTDKVGLQLVNVAGKDSSKAVRYGDVVWVLDSSQDNNYVTCSTDEGCEVGLNDCSPGKDCASTRFIVTSKVWKIGRAVALRDEVYLQHLEQLDGGSGDWIETGKYLDASVSNIADIELSDVLKTFIVTVDPLGWSDTESDCQEDCMKTITRTCIGDQTEYCPGSDQYKSFCDCPNPHSGCGGGSPEAKSNYSGTYDWKSYKTEDAKKMWYALCPYGDFTDRFKPQVVIAECIHAECTSDPEVPCKTPKYVNTTCSFESEAAQALYKILWMTDIDESNLEEVSGNTAEAVKAADDLSAVHVNLVADIAETISEKTNISESVVGSVLDVVDVLTTEVSEEDIKASSVESGGPKKLVDSIESVSRKIEPQEGKTEIRIKRPSVGISVVKVTDPGPVSFKVISTSANQPLDETEFDINGSSDEDEVKEVRRRRRREAETEEEEEEGAASSVGIEIAEDVAKASGKLSFVIFRESKMFVTTSEPSITPLISGGLSEPFSSGTLSIRSSVLGGSVSVAAAGDTDAATTTRKTPAATLTMSTQQNVNKSNTPYCVYWDDAEQMWSQTGLQITGCDTEAVSCTSNHLTNFAILMNVGNNTFSPAHTTAMTVLTITGSSLSILCLTLTVVGLAIGKMRRNPTYHIHLCLAFTLALALIIFNVGLERREHWLMCKIFAVLIHYLFLAAICWMLVEGVNLYIALIIVFGVNHKKLKIASHCFAWGFPALVCLITVIVDLYVEGFELYEVCMTAKYCFLNHRGRMYFFVAPIMAMMAANIFIFIRVIIVLAKATKNRDGWTDLRQVTVIASITGISWVFGALTVGGSVGTLVFNYLYIILNSVQGILIFYFHCFGKPDVRNAWTEKLSTGTSLFTGSTSNSQGAYGKVTAVKMPQVAKARPLNEVLANKSAAGKTLTSYELSHLESGSQGGTAGRKISTLDGRYSSTAGPRVSTTVGPGKPRMSSAARYSTTAAPMPFQANPNPRKQEEKKEAAPCESEPRELTPVEDVEYSELDLDIKMKPLDSIGDAIYETVDDDNIIVNKSAEPVEAGTAGDNTYVSFENEETKQLARGSETRKSAKGNTGRGMVFHGDEDVEI